MRNIKMTIKYDGSRYKGFQRLQDNDMTIQGKLETVIRKMTEEPVEIIGSGRTDMGVHAYGQVANFKTTSEMTLKKMKAYLYEYLPEDIVVTNLEEADERFHSRYNAKSKVYLYKIYNNEVHDPFLRKYTNHIARKLDLNLMKEASKQLVGEHDFTSFVSSKSKKKSNVRNIHSIEIQENNNVIEIYVEADGFLYNMVRIIVGTLIDAGLRKKTVKDIEYMLKAKDRSVSSETAPSKGLCLYKVKY